VALAVWFGAIDRLGAGEGRCSSCGVEGYVVAAHVAAAIWLGGVVAYAAAVRRRLREGVGAPGRATVAVLAAIALYVAACLLWHPLFSPPALAAMVASLLVYPVTAVYWIAEVVARVRRPPRDEAELDLRARRTLLLAWVSLVVLLPATFGWIWADRVDWLVF
jgi:hypothetical protein